MPDKNITLVQLNNAIKLISDYKIQLEELSESLPVSPPKKIDISQSINPQNFKVLLNYYKDIYNKKLERADLAAMDVELLKAIDYNKLRNYRGFGFVSECKFKQIMIEHSVLDESEM